MNNFFYTKCFILLILGTFSCGNFDCNDQQYENLKVPQGEGDDNKKQNILFEDNVFERIMNNLQKHKADLKKINHELHNIAYPPYYHNDIFNDFDFYQGYNVNNFDFYQGYNVNNFDFTELTATSYYCGDWGLGIGQKKIGQVYYTGRFTGDQGMNGFGVINNTQDRILYAGQVQYDLPCGLGFLRTSDGSWKFGNFKQLRIDPCLSNFTFISGFKYDAHALRSYKFDFNQGNPIHEIFFNKESTPSENNIQYDTLISSYSELLGGIDRNNDLWIRVNNIKLKLNREGANIKALYCYDDTYINNNKYDNYDKFIKIDFDDNSLIAFDDPSSRGFDNHSLSDFYNTNFIEYQKILKANYGDQLSLFSIKKISYAEDLRVEYGLIPYLKNHFTPWYNPNSWSWGNLETIKKYACRKIGFDSSKKPYFRTDILHNDSTISTLEIHDEGPSLLENKIFCNNVNNQFVEYLNKIQTENQNNTILQDNIFQGEIKLKYEWPLDDIFNDNSEIQKTIGLNKTEINDVKEKIIEIIQKLGDPNRITFNSIVSEVEEYSLGNIDGLLYKLFIKKEGEKFLIHNRIGHL